MSEQSTDNDGSDSGFEDFEQLESEEETPKDETIAYLSERVQEIEEERDEERFVWLLLVIIVIDFYAFSSMNSWGGPIAILVLELFFLIIMGRRLGVDDIRQLTDRMIDSVWKSKKE